MGLDTVELILWAEQHFDITILDEDASTIITVGEFSRHISALHNKTHGSNINEEDVFNTLKNHLHTQFGVKPEHITRQAKIVNDLGLQ